MEKRKEREGDKVVGKREKGDGKHAPFSRRTLVISFTNFFSNQSRKKKKRGNEGWGDEGEGKREER